MGRLLVQLGLDQVLPAGDAAEQVFAVCVGLGGGDQYLPAVDYLKKAHKAAGYYIAHLVADNAADGAVVGAGIHRHGQVDIGDGTVQNGDGRGGGGDMAHGGSNQSVDAVGHVIEGKLAVIHGVGGGDYLTGRIEQRELGAGQRGGREIDQRLDDAGNGTQGERSICGTGQVDLTGVALCENNADSGAEQIPLFDRSHGISAGGDAFQSVAAGYIGYSVLEGRSLAVKQLDGGIGNGRGPVGDSTDKGCGGSWDGRQRQVDVRLLGSGNGEILAVLQLQKILSDIGHKKLPPET